MAGPLGHIRVLEVANFIAGPYAGMLLADLGADVVKIEEPEAGDPFRSWGEGLYSPHYVAYNRSKRSITVNLRHPQGVAVVRRLAATADVLVENMRPGVADRLGIGYAALSAVNPRIVFCSMSGFGESGPYAARPAYDGVIQALSGLMSQLTEAVAPRPAGPAFADNLAGLFAVCGIMGALVQREQTGRGQRVQVPMLGCALSFLGETLTRHFMLGEDPGPARRPQVAQLYAFTCADGKPLAIHLSSPQKFWLGLLKVAGREELARDPRFVDRDARMQHYEELQSLLRSVFVTRPRPEWLAALTAADVPCAPVNTLPEALADPQVQHLGLEVDLPWPPGVEQVGRLHAVGCALRFSAADLPPVTSPPALGADTDAVLTAAGWSPAEVVALRAEQAI